MVSIGKRKVKLSVLVFIGVCIKQMPAKVADDIPAGNAERGKKLFVQRCAECHTVEKDGSHKIGPNLFGIIGRKTGQAPDYNYTQANRENNITWSRQTLFKYLESPRKFIPGTKMVFNGLKDKDKRADVIAYLEESTVEKENPNS